MSIFKSGGSGSLTNPMSALGDTIYGVAGGDATKLAGNATSTKMFLAQQGNGIVSAAPAWVTLANGDIPYTTTATASTVMGRDASINTAVNEIARGVASVVTATGSTNLDATSAPRQFFTGTAIQSVFIGDARNLAVGFTYEFINESTGNISVNDNASSLLGTAQTLTTLRAILTNNSTAAGTWKVTKYFSNAITALTSDVTAGSGPGSVAATVNSVGGSSASSINTTVTTVTAATSAATASTLAKRDSNANIVFNGVSEGVASIATAAATTTLTNASAKTQVFTGSTTQNVVLPDGQTCSNGQTFVIVNKSTGNVTLKNSGATTQLIVKTNTAVECVCNDNTASTTWVQKVIPFTAGSGAVNSTNYAFDTIAPMTTVGDMVYSGGSPATVTRLAGNTTATKKFLTQTGDGANSAAPGWNTIATGDVPDVSATYLTTAGNLAGVANAATSFNNISGMTLLGDLVYGGTSGARTVLAGNTTSTKKFLTQTGNGSVSAAPSWGTIATTDVSGTVALANGGTGQTTKAPAFDALQPMSASGDIIYGGTSGTGTRLPKGTDGNVLGQASGIPAWVTGSEVFVSSAQTADGTTTSSSYGDFSNNISITFTPTKTGKYLIFCAPQMKISTNANGRVELLNSAGGATINFNSTAYFTSPTAAIQFIGQVTLFVIATLTSGTSYTFKTQGKTDSGTLTLYNSAPDNGQVILAVSLE